MNLFVIYEYKTLASTYEYETLAKNPLSCMFQVEAKFTYYFSNRVIRNTNAYTTIKAGKCALLRL